MKWYVLCTLLVIGIPDKSDPNSVSLACYSGNNTGVTEEEARLAAHRNNELDIRYYPNGPRQYFFAVPKSALEIYGIKV